MHAPSFSRAAARQARWPLVLGLLAGVVTGTVDLTSATSPTDATAYVPLNPCRLVDTRPGSDNVGHRATPLGPDETVTLDGHGQQGNCTGAAALPTDATGLQLNVTAINATQATFLTLYPSGGTRPTASHLNPAPGATAAPNAVTVKLDDTGRFDVYNRFGTVDVIIDVVGIYTDHHHDDRYYNRADIDSMMAQWKISIPPPALTVVATDDELWIRERAFAPDDHVGIRYAFQLPDHYVAGRDLLVAVTITVNDGSDCAALLVTSGTSAVAPDGSNQTAVARFVEPSDPESPVTNVLPVRGSADTRGVVIPIRIDGQDLRPGSWVRSHLHREGANGEDTCPLALVRGVTVQAEG